MTYHITYDAMRAAWHVFTRDARHLAALQQQPGVLVQTYQAADGTPAAWSVFVPAPDNIQHEAIMDGCRQLAAVLQEAENGTFLD